MAIRFRARSARTKVARLHFGRALRSMAENQSGHSLAAKLATPLALAVAFGLGTSPGSAVAQEIQAPTAATASSPPAAGAPAIATEPRFALHGQATVTTQAAFAFASPYSGTNSLAPAQVKETADVTAYLGVRLWRGAELWANPEIDQGFGLSDTLGVAGFPSAEAYKVGKASPYFKLHRLFLRQTIALGGEASAVDGTANQMAGSQTANRLVITLGKFSATDVFDTNRYAHDPRADFLNWSVVDTGSFDYAANAWGYSYGAAVEWYQGPWTLRLGAFNLSKLPNDIALGSDFSQFQLNGEIEHRHAFHGHAGAVRLTFFRNHGNFLKLSDALAAFNTSGTLPDPASLRHVQTRWGGQLNIEQELSSDLGVFLRAGIADGSIETYDFTDIDRTLALGAQLTGSAWGRGQDRIGLAGVVNAISRTRQQYLADGGLGILVGDGRLPHPGHEWIAEAYYDWQMVKGVSLTIDYQFIANPGYNRDRGPANVLAVRVHAAF